MLRFPSNAPEHDLRQAIIECGRICYERQLMVSNDGNISVRFDENLLLITPAGFPKSRLDANDLLLIDLTGRVHASKSGLYPSSETPMHLEVYKQRPEIRAVVHAHPVFVTALTVAGLPFPKDVLAEAMLTLGDVPISEYAAPSSDEDAEAIRPLIREHNAIILRQHGSLTVGKDLEEALIHLERMEHVAEVFWRAQMLGHVEHIPLAVKDLLLASRKKDW